MENRRQNENTPACFVIFGGAGDLSWRKLTPALFDLFVDQSLPEAFVLIALDQREISTEDLSGRLRDGVAKFSRSQPTDQTWGSFAEHLRYARADFADDAAYEQLAQQLQDLDQQYDQPADRIFYLATPPSLFSVIPPRLQKAGLADDRQRARIVVEKPIGYDLDSARRLNRTLTECFDESQIFRIDHYLGKETVQNMLVFRFGNGIFEPLWNNRYVEHVQITGAESLGVEGRGAYYEEAGILRDMVQNHLFQVLSLMGMEPPVSMESNAVRDEKVKFLRSLRPLPPDRVDDFVVRAQYTRGHVLGESVVGYRQEPGVAAESVTETYVALKLAVDNWRWANVPIFLRSAKRMPKRVTEIAIQFRQAPHLLFGKESGQDPVPNVLSIRIQPDEGISLHFGSKIPGPTMEAAPVNMEFRYGTSFGNEPPEAYERLILDAMLGDSTLFTRDDEVEASWTFITGIHQAWAHQRRRQIPFYEAGSWGPPEADDLLGEGIRWRHP